MPWLGIIVTGSVEMNGSADPVIGNRAMAMPISTRRIGFSMEKWRPQLEMSTKLADQATAIVLTRHPQIPVRCEAGIASSGRPRNNKSRRAGQEASNERCNDN